MSAIKLYTSKTDAFYFKDSQRNSFYEFGAIQLIPNTTYVQKASGLVVGVNNYTVSAYKASDNSEIDPSSFISNVEQPFFIDNTSLKIDNTSLKIDTNSNAFFYWSIN